MKIINNYLTVSKFSRPGVKRVKTTAIAVHYVGNPGTTADNNRNYFENLKSQIADSSGKYCINKDGSYVLYNGKKVELRYVSSNYIIGLQGEVICCVPPDEIAYCTNQANAYSISIECCHPDNTGKFTEATEKALVELVAYLLKKYNLGVNAVIRHYDVTGKQCPLYYVPTKYQSEAVANERWNGLKAKVATELGTSSDTTAKMYYVQVGAFSSKTNAQKYLAEVKKNYPNAFIKEE